MKDFSISKNKSKIRITLFLLLCLIISSFTACDNLLFNEKLKEIISEDIGTSFSFFEYDDESSQHIDKTYIIGKTVSSKDFPEFLHEETMIVGWQYLKNPNTDSTEMPSNYYLNERDYISSINVSPEPAYLYAVWKKKCTITFVTGCDVQLEPYVLPEGYTVPSEDYVKWNENLKKPKFVFRDWYLDEDCTELFDYTIPVTGNITLYAKWVEQITVTYHSNDGKNRTNVYTNDVDTFFFIDDCFFGERSGYGFVGWAESASATTPDYYYSDNISNLTKDMDLYAVWSTDVVTITYKENCNIPGIVENRTRQVHYGKGAHACIGRFYVDNGWDLIYYDWNKTGYEIKGYDFSASSTKPKYNKWGYNEDEVSQYYLLNSDITLYAIWGAKQYEVYFVWEETDPSGITYQPWCYVDLPLLIDYNTAIPRPATDPVRPGYTFEDWYIREWNYITQDYEYKLYDFSTILNEENFGLNTEIRIFAQFTEGGSNIGNFDASISFYADPEQDISVTVTQSSSTYIFTADPGYESYQWTLDGSTQSSTGNILEVDTSSLYVGIHDLYLKAKDSYGNWYSYYGKITKE